MRNDLKFKFSKNIPGTLRFRLPPQIRYKISPMCTVFTAEFMKPIYLREIRLSEFLVMEVELSDMDDYFHPFFI